MAKRRDLTNRRRWLWKNKPTLMEAGRAKATRQAALNKNQIAMRIRDRVSTWPELMTPAQLDEHLMTLPYVRKGKKRRMSRASLVRRLRSLGLIAYQPTTNTWSKICNLPSETSLPPSSQDDQGTTQRPDRPCGGGAEL
jgi:hypothetical protein